MSTNVQEMGKLLSPIMDDTYMTVVLHQFGNVRKKLTVMFFANREPFHPKKITP